MTPNLKAALQESLKQEDEAVKARLQEPAPSAKAPKAAKPAAKRAVPAKPKAPAPAKAEKPKPAVKKAAPARTRAPKVKLPKAAAEPKSAPAAEAPKAVKVSRESFSLPESEAATLKGLRTAVAREGRIATKSELLRAGIQLLTGLQSADLIAALNALPPVVKKKKKK